MKPRTSRVTGPGCISSLFQLAALSHFFALHFLHQSFSCKPQATSLPQDKQEVETNFKNVCQCALQMLEAGQGGGVQLAQL